uniref:RNA-directed RNA polymerase n=1 Tax=Lepidozia ophiovirus_pli TaxID=2983947 RepID=A0A9N6YK45_9VIRU|nr:TPA_asm: polymerase [Lepidozia ophiovirus_pli]
MEKLKSVSWADESDDNETGFNLTPLDTLFLDEQFQYSDSDASDNEYQSPLIEEHEEDAELSKKHCIEYLNNLGANSDHHPTLYMIAEEFGGSHDLLIKSQSNEARLEPDKETFEFPQMFNHFSEDIDLRPPKVNQAPPEQIDKINFPFVTFSEENLKFFSETSKYPEKWSNKQRTDLMILRTLIKQWNLECISSQWSVIDNYNQLLSSATASVKASTLWKMSARLEQFESNKLSQNYRNISLDIDHNIDLTETTLKAAWVLDFIESINYKVKIDASKKMQGLPTESSGLFTEGKRVEVTVFPHGQIHARMIVMGGHKIELYKSRTISAISDGNFTNLMPGSGIDYLMTLADHGLTLNVIRDHASKEERPFVDYLLSLNKISNTKKRATLASLYESNCLLGSDLKSICSRMPVLDNIYETVSASPQHAEQIYKIIMSSTQSTCVKMSCIGKTLHYAQVSHEEGLRKYTQRTNRDHPVDQNVIERLRSMFKMKMVTNYIKKNNKMPELSMLPADLQYELDVMASGGKYNKQITHDSSYYKTVKLGKMLEPGNEMNLESRIIDKACTTDTYHDNGVNSVKELIYYLQKEALDKPSDLFTFERQNNLRKLEIKDRKEISISKSHTIVRLVEKEKEQKIAPRFYGIASFSLKTWMSKIMEMAKRAMKMMPGQMMTMTEDQRRDIMYRMSSMLREENAYSLFLDYSGHNTSQRPENTSFIMEEIANMYGFVNGSEEYKEFVSIVDAFNNIEVISENTYSDNVYHSHGQKGAIEGWLGTLWGIQSQLMLEAMLSDFKINRQIATTYSDDSCAVFIMKDATPQKLDSMVEDIQNFSMRMGLIVKLSQTQVTNSRCSMLKVHYVRDNPIEHNYKKMMGISQNSSRLWGDNLECVKLIDSGFTAACEKSDNHMLQVRLRNYRALTVIFKDLIQLSMQLEWNMDSRFAGLYRHRFDKVKSGLKEMQLDEFLSTIKSDEDLTNWGKFPKLEMYDLLFIHLHLKNEDLLSLFLAFLYLPYTMYGFSLSSIPDSVTSGFSISGIKRITYVRSFLNDSLREQIGRLIKLSDEATRYVSAAFPLTGGRFDTGTMLKDMLRQHLPKFIKNKDLKDLFNADNRKDEEEMMLRLVHSFKYCMSNRIASKYFEESVFSFITNLCNKVDNTSTFLMMIGKRLHTKIWNKAWKSNHNLQMEFGEHNTMNYHDLVLYRDKIKKYTFRTVNKKRIQLEEVEMSFLKIEEIPTLGAIEIRPGFDLFSVIMRGPETMTKTGPKKLPPMKTAVNAPKFDRQSGIAGMFQSKLVFQALEIVRYTKWILMELNKFSKVSKLEATSLISICDMTLSTFTDARYTDLESGVVSPVGGRYFHRANSGGFKSRTGDLTSHYWSGRYEFNGIESMQSYFHGEDNNINIQYVMTTIKIILGYLKTRPKELKGYSFDASIIPSIKDVTFNITGIEYAEEMEMNTKIPLKDMNTSRTLYKAYSQFLASKPDNEEEFISFASGSELKLIAEETTFRQVFSYMADQNIITPEVISDDVLRQLLLNYDNFTTKEQFFKEFYDFYSSLNIIGRESPSASMIRGLLYKELFKHDSQGRVWSKEMTTKGFSMDYRHNLLRLFIIACGLIYTLKTNNGRSTLHINTVATKINSVRCFKAILNRTHHIHIKDRAISQILIYGFPTMSYTVIEVEKCSDEISMELNHKVFEQYKLYDYFKTERSSYIEKDESKVYGSVNYYSFGIDMYDLKDQDACVAAIKAFEYICALSCTVENLSSPTKSDIYPAARGVIKCLQGSQFLTEKDTVADLCAGRGDFHLALTEAKVNHTSVSRNDGFNLINRIKGMKEKKPSWNVFSRENFMDYMDHSIILLDVSHFTGKKDLLTKGISEMIAIKKKIVLRWNAVSSIITQKLIDVMGQHCNIELLIPEKNSSGVLYLTLEAKEKEGKIVSRKRSNKGFAGNLILEYLSQGNIGFLHKPMLSHIGKDVVDHTEEFITDDELLDSLMSHTQDSIVEVPQSLKNNVRNSDDIRALLCTSAEGLQHIPGIKTEYLDYITSDLDIGFGSFVSCMKHYRRTGETRLEVINEKADILPKIVITGFEEMKFSDLTMVVQHIQDQNTLPITKDLWMFLLDLAKDYDKISSDDIIPMISIESLRNSGVGRTIDNLFTTTTQVINSWKSGRTKEGLIAISGLERVNLSTIMRVKTKNNRNNIINYKLILNRINRIVKKVTDINITANNQDLESFVKDIWKTEVKAGRMNDEDLQKFREHYAQFKTIQEFIEASNADNDNFFNFINSMDLDKNVEQITIDEPIKTDAFIKGLFKDWDENVKKNQEIEQSYMLTTTYDEFKDEEQERLQNLERARNMALKYEEFEDDGMDFDEDW